MWSKLHCVQQLLCRVSAYPLDVLSGVSKLIVFLEQGPCKSSVRPLRSLALAVDGCPRRMIRYPPPFSLICICGWRLVRGRAPTSDGADGVRRARRCARPRSRGAGCSIMISHRGAEHQRSFSPRARDACQAETDRRPPEAVRDCSSSRDSPHHERRRGSLGARTRESFCPAPCAVRSFELLR